MFSTLSMTATGIITLGIMALAKWLNVAGVDDSSAAALATSVVQVGGFLLACIGQLRREDLSMGIFHV